MLKNSITNILFVTVALILNGCALIPAEMQEHIGTCSEETNAYTPSQRIGNSAYWSCLDREKKQTERNEIKLQCKDYGFVEGSADFSKCLMSVDSERKLRKQISNEAERTRSMIQYK